jgi:hypothetical protein
MFSKRVGKHISNISVNKQDMIPSKKTSHDINQNLYYKVLCYSPQFNTPQDGLTKRLDITGCPERGKDAINDQIK